MKFSKFISVLTTCIAFVNIGFGQQNIQPCKNIPFKNFDSVLNDLRQNGVHSMYFDSLTYADYEAMASLDLKASYNTLKAINPTFEKEIGLDSSQLATLIPKAKEENYAINMNSITDLFCNAENLKFVIRKHAKDELILFELSETVYIKDTTAYFTIYTSTWSDTFLATYSNKNLTLIWLWGIQQ